MKYKKVLTLTAKYNKLAQVQYDPSGEKSAPGKLQMGETTVIGDPNTGPGSPSSGQENTKQVSYQKPQRIVKLPWEPIVGTKPSNLDETSKKALIDAGYKYIEPLGWVEPKNVQRAQTAKQKGWVYAGGGYGLVPQDWYNYLNQSI